MKRYLFVFQKGNRGKDNPVLSVVPWGNHFTGSFSLCYETQHGYETGKMRVLAHLIVCER